MLGWATIPPMPSSPRPLIVGLGLALALLGVGGGWMTWHDAARVAPLIRDGRPHVVLVMGCTVRRHELTPYGGPPETTPNLASFAAQGVRFTDGITTAPWTREASTALLTGHFAISVGMADPGRTRSERALSPVVTTLSERFHEAGYATLGVTANPNISEGMGFAQGFDQYESMAGPWRVDRLARSVQGTAVVERALQMAGERAEGRPLYLQVMLTDAHLPYDWVTEEDVRQMRAPDVPERVVRYRAALRRLDDAFGGLLRGLDRLGYSEANTIFVFVNDHGEALSYPEHHGVAHGRLLFSTVTSMAWLMRGRGVARGHVVDGLASGVDLAPTLLELAGLDPLEGPGRSWARQVRGDARRTDRSRAYSDTWFQESSRAAVFSDETECHHDWAPALGGPAAAARLSPSVACYDRRADPFSERPLAEPHPLLVELDAWRRDRVAEQRAWAHVTFADSDLETEAQLRALGYAE